jgi:adenine-specific DNA-methyltransferase
VAKLNAADGGSRRFILVSSTEATVDAPEKNICRDVCAERVRRVMAGYGEVPGLGGDFAYLRCRRIAEGELLDIPHEQVWTALQLLHRDTLEPATAQPLHWRDHPEYGALAYVEKLGRGVMTEIKKRAKLAASVLIYTWQPSIVKAQLIAMEHVQVESIPQSLARKFGFKLE